MRACILIRDDPKHRRQSFVDGLLGCGFDIVDGPVDKPRPRDVLVIWTRHKGGRDDDAKRYEAAGADVLVVENGYIGSFREGGSYYAIALGDTNGAGKWHVGGNHRLRALGVTFSPWREDGEQIVVFAQRGIGSAKMASPQNWHTDAVKRLSAQTKRPIVVRDHPGKGSGDLPPLKEILRGAWCAVTWASNAATEALIRGIPVLYEAPHIITAGAALPTNGLNRYGRDRLESPCGTRAPAFNRLAWAQWHTDEIAAGKPFRYLLNNPRL